MNLVQARNLIGPSSEKRKEQREARGLYQEALSAARRAMQADGVNIDPQGPFSQYGPVHGPIVRSAAELRAIAETQGLVDLISRLDESGFSRIVNLIDNQPQFYVTATLRERDDFVGPDEFELRVAYEMGLQNLNSLRRFAAQSDVCGKNSELELSNVLLECLDGYFDSFGSKIGSGRFVFSAEFLRRQSLDIALDSPAAIMLRQDSFNDTRVNLAYGRYVSLLGAAGTNARLDFGLSYLDVDGDPERNDRAFAELTLSRRVSGPTFLTFGLVYSNKPEYRGPVDQELSARLGLNYKISSP